MSCLVFGKVASNLVELDALVQLGQSLLLLCVFFALLMCELSLRVDAEARTNQNVADVDGLGAFGFAAAALFVAACGLTFAARLVRPLLVVLGHDERLSLSALPTI